MRVFTCLKPSLIMPAVRRCLKQRSTSETTDGGRFERFWRPLFGYAVSVTWVLHMLTICRVVWEDNPRAPEIIMALVETTSLWSVALGVFGISVVKTSVVRKTPKKQLTKPTTQTKGENNGRSF